MARRPDLPRLPTTELPPRGPSPPGMLVFTPSVCKSDEGVAMAPRWSEHEDRILRRLYADGVPHRAIAEAVGRSEDAVSERRRTLGMPARSRSRPWSPLEDELLRGGTAMGLPAAALATRLGRPPEEVRRRRRALVGAAPAPAPFTAADDAAIAACWAGSRDVEALARELGRPAGS